MIGLLIMVVVSMMFIKVRSTFLRLSVSISLFLGLGAAYYLGWEKLEPRIINSMKGFEGRMEISELALKMIDEYPIFGSGPGSFEGIAQFELKDSFTTWASWVHNDYLEFLLTFGQPGMVLMVGAVCILLLNMAMVLFFGQQKPILLFGLLSLLGVAIHAAGDFPLQVLSILILICLITTTLTDHGRNRLGIP